MPKPTTIPEVVAALTEIVDTSIAQESRVGYFAALYRRVTETVGARIDSFDDPARMERFDVAFASRYLDAYAAFRSGAALTSSWKVAFSATNDANAIVLQHLLLGMNAHINLDLGIAAALIAPGDELVGLRGDFLKINALLASLVPTVIEEVAAVSPLIDLVSRVIGPTDDDRIANFSLEAARDWAWHVAEVLAPMSSAAQEERIALLDRVVAAFGRQLWHPDPILESLYHLIRSAETDSIAEVIETLVGVN